MFVWRYSQQVLMRRKQRSDCPSKDTTPLSSSPPFIPSLPHPIILIPHPCHLALQLHSFPVLVSHECAASASARLSIVQSQSICQSVTHYILTVRMLLCLSIRHTYCLCGKDACVSMRRTFCLRCDDSCVYLAHFALVLSHCS